MTNLKPSTLAHPKAQLLCGVEVGEDHGSMVEWRILKISDLHFTID